MQKTKRTKSEKIKMLCLASVMAALYVALDFLAVSVSAPFGGTLKLSFSGLPVIIVSIVGGPLWGAATGFVGAFIGQLVTYGLAPTTLLWVLPAVVRGLLFGFLFNAFGRRTSVGILAVETCVSSLAVTLINTGALLIDQTIYKCSSYYTTFAAIPTRIIAGILTAIVFSIMLPTIIELLRKHLKMQI